jgi:Protein of unknown function (DUF4235)
MSDEIAAVEDDDLIEPSTLAKIAVPALTLAAAFVIRKALDTAYEKSTGKTPPKATDPDTSLRRAIVYAAVTAAAVAVANVAIGRLNAPKRRTT